MTKQADHFVTIGATVIAVFVVLTCFPMPCHSAMQPGQIRLERVETMPNLPKPYLMRDWKQAARDFDKLVYSDPEMSGQYLPLLWLDRNEVNGKHDMWVMPSYVGHPAMAPGGSHESITNMAGVLSGLLVGIDKTMQNGKDYVAGMHGYFNSANGENLYLNRVSTGTGYTFWYEAYPNVLAWQLHFAAPKAAGFDERLRKVSERLFEARWAMAAGDKTTSIPDFSFTAFDFRAGKAVDNGKWREPDGAAAFAWLLEMAWLKWKEPRYLEAADACLAYLDKLPYDKNPYYEVLLPFGVVCAARMNAEQGRSYDLHKLLSWIFGVSDARPGFGVIADGSEGHWGGYDFHGALGSYTDGGGYAFEMNGYSTAAALAPVARYDDRYARALGKWLLNLSNASRLFYGNGLPPENQTCHDWITQHDPNFVAAYEGVRRRWKGISPKAMGDPLVHGWARTDLGLYGSAHAGLLGAIVDKTNVEGILRIDLLATDWAHGPAYPTYLMFNPYAETKTARINTGEDRRDVYEATGNRFIARGVKGDAFVEIPGDSAYVIVLPPAGGKLTTDANRTLIDGVVIDYNNDLQPLRAPTRLYDAEKLTSAHIQSRTAHAPRATIHIDGDVSDWQGVKGDSVRLDTHGRGSLVVDLRFAWDADNFYLVAMERSAGTTHTEAATPESYAAAPWEYDGISLFIDLRNRNVLEDVKDVNPWFGFSSKLATDMFCVRSHLEAACLRDQFPKSRSVAVRDVKCRTAAGGRVIEAACAWADMARAVEAHRQPDGGLANAIRPGFKFGCDPLLLENGWRSQSFLSGESSKTPMGDEPWSIDILLEESGK
ncbi:MAG: hypothetical protein NTY46_03535 [Candidatus Sumerlaeota bacterium]|nr:hypothetical protein [Candidatus Sumerlaeota bacterium]